jgi:hypothetical protein
MPFQPGNQEQKKADRKKPRVVAQQLTSALNEAYGDGNITKLRAVIDAWVANAIKGDQQAINALADRIDGKVPQAIGGDDELGPIKNILEVSWKSDDSGSS